MGEMIRMDWLEGGAARACSWLLWRKLPLQVTTQTHLLFTLSKKASLNSVKNEQPVGMAIN
jgi:hypothetical protein